MSRLVPWLVLLAAGCHFYDWSLPGPSSDAGTDGTGAGDGGEADGPSDKPRTNLCTNPSFETGRTNWAMAFGYTAATLESSPDRAMFGTRSLKVTWPTAVAADSTATYNLSGLAISTRYTFSIWAFVPARSPRVKITEAFGGGTDARSINSSTAVTKDAWVRLDMSLNASNPTHYFAIVNEEPASAGQLVYLDGALMEASATVGSYFDGDTPGAMWTAAPHESASTLPTAAE